MVGYWALWQLFGSFADDEYYLTKLRADISADKMIDIELVGYYKEDYLDSDGDGWSDAEEAIAGTEPNKVDTYGDVMWDPEDPYPLTRKAFPAYALLMAIIASLTIGFLIWLASRRVTGARQ